MKAFFEGLGFTKKRLQSTCFTVNFNKLFRQLFYITPSNGCFIILGKLNKNNFNQSCISSFKVDKFLKRIIHFVCAQNFPKN